ncbi:DAK2 domain-containing protein [Evansella sp. AB-P1]|uniref:DAK2 domain-containing protein n=1 Tax=Evansella sp. AB-P1 TaxID=3037653 RepID=UPI00241D4FF1|nr:DAK2 domain-containing protein [Evansella sp. AB-P1]MDG5788235.1 DAK2 domain-containing protein [Evansella sp. AB-P1]
MTIKIIEGEKFAHMLIEGANNLSNNSKTIDALNVFPVPDGDTGTNMNLTITSGVKEVKGNKTEHVGQIASAFAKGLLMGARGNSGVILSQLFRGFSKSVEGKETITAKDLSSAFEFGVDMAYKAVMKPVEGTILTVAKDSAKKAIEFSKKNDDTIQLMEAVVAESKASLKRTPDLLPVLKEVGVVDSGGQGLVTIYEGFLAVLKGEKVVDLVQHDSPSMNELVQIEHHQASAQSHMSTEDIEFGYCTEVMVKFESDKVKENPFSEDDFRNTLNNFGDSLLVVSDEDLLKVHIHAEYPGDVITEAQKFGSLVNVKIENMREQHSSILEQENAENALMMESKPAEKTEYAIITVAMGEGIADLFTGLGAKKVIAGGQTMNPATEDFVKAIDEANAEKIILLPNNSNIVMAAEQAASVSDGEVVVVPSKSVPQGLAALLSFNPSGTLSENKNEMIDSLSRVKTGEVTYAVRDTSLNGVEIKKGDFMGIVEKDIVSTKPDVQEVAKELVQKMLDEDSEIITIIYGEDRSEEEANVLVAYLEENFEEVEVEVHNGNQPLYSYIISVE